MEFNRLINERLFTIIVRGQKLMPCYLKYISLASRSIIMKEGILINNRTNKILHVVMYIVLLYISPIYQLSMTTIRLYGIWKQIKQDICTQTYIFGDIKLNINSKYYFPTNFRKFILNQFRKFTFLMFFLKPALVEIIKILVIM